ncbi:uncharacterized protein SCHCODRAFT_02616348 [Schizophyllum commune H4-8]|uniref:uncharacterized protein n=1 Tax=Schizophyllum commune (strain H4-8 / FGSC 9210) TaxID=578458 RepID=UPI0021609B75|nr:uncharacterized protein SCHCODRAFT_02616348 [Schizophyllum commune H4-8]KAI5896973.1 hypothetical protein SCHCODRAFT_02616348 [Schizophyllum commune H4-8]
MANNAASLVHRLNALLVKLQIPINVEFPTDLTPSLLLAILESILSARIPIEPDLRRRLTTQRDFDAKVRCMKLFLGVLESDVLKVDVNLDKVDPRKLARGDWDEVVYVGELLCQIGELLGLLPQGAKRGLPMAPASSTSNTPTSARRTRRATVNTSALASTSMNDRSASSDPGPQRSFASLTSPIPGTSRERRTRRCIHALQTPELLSTRKHLFDTSALAADDFTTCNCPAADIPHLAPSKRSKSTSPRSTAVATAPVRRNGYIQSVDEEEELHSFESARSTTIGDEDTSRFSFEHVSSILANLDLEEAEPWSHARTLQLKRERARLLSELAKYETPQ